MKILLAETAGFCMGVQRAFDRVLAVAKGGAHPVFTLGPLIHNPQAVELLKAQGIGVINTPEEAPPDSTIVIRAHGVPRGTMQAIENRGARVANATCPIVSRVQAAVKQHALKNGISLIIGEPEHPEVIGLLSMSSIDGKGRGFVIRDEADLAALPTALENVLVISQTTTDQDKFERLSALLLTRYQGAQIRNTICNATMLRQNEVRTLAGKCDAVLVLGGKTSANTRHLADIAREYQKPTFLVETLGELDALNLAGIATLGVTAGASTPHWLVQEAIKSLEERYCRGRLVGSGRILRVLDALGALNLMMGLSAGLITYAGISLTGLHLDTPGMSGSASWIFMTLTACYAMLIPLVTMLFDNPYLETRHPGRQQFFRGNRRAILLFAGGLLAGSLAIASLLDGWALGFYMLAIIVGIGYSLPFGKVSWGRFSIRRLRDVHGSKEAFVGAGIASVAVLTPILHAQDFHFVGVLDLFKTMVFWGTAWLFVAMLMTLRAVFLELRFTASDRLLISESMVSAVGLKWILPLWSVCLLLLVGGLLSVSFWYPNPWTPRLLALVPALLLGVVGACHVLGTRRSAWAEFASDMASLLALILAYAATHEWLFT